MTAGGPPRLRENTPLTARLRVSKLVGGGRALGHHDGEVWMVAGALPGEEIIARVTARRAGIIEANADDVTDSPHAARLADPCPHAPDCGGCDWPHVEPEAGAALKAAAAAEAARFAPAIAASLAAAAVRTSPLGYRLRARMHWDPLRRVLGFYAPRSWRVTPIPSCRIVSQRLAGSFMSLIAALAESCPRPVDVEWLEDLSGTSAVAALRPAAKGPDRLAADWVPRRESLLGVVDGFHLLSRAGHVRSGWGRETVAIALPIPLEVPVGSFFQGNRHLTPWLFERVAGLVGDRPTPTWDLHAGVGLLAAAAASAAPRPLQLVEPHAPAARAAQRNLPEARIAIGRTAEDYLEHERRQPADALVITDPPRAGMSPSLRRHLAGWRPDRILTLGCDPATWARDVAFLLDRGYRLGHVELVDLFPSTHHVEVLALLEAE